MLYNASMAKIYIAKLDPITKNKILQKQYSLHQLQEMHTLFIKNQKRKQKRFHQVFLLTIVLTILLCAMTYRAQPDLKMILFVFVVVILLVVSILIVCWICAIGYLKFQFNHLLQKTYPEYASMLRL